MNRKKFMILSTRESLYVPSVYITLKYIVIVFTIFSALICFFPYSKLLIYILTLAYLFVSLFSSTIRFLVYWLFHSVYDVRLKTLLAAVEKKFGNYESVSIDFNDETYFIHSNKFYILRSLLDIDEESRKPKPLKFKIINLTDNCNITSMSQFLIFKFRLKIAVYSIYFANTFIISLYLLGLLFYHDVLEMTTIITILAFVIDYNATDITTKYNNI